jgi:capsular polysaccharide transport system permease protein
MPLRTLKVKNLFVGMVLIPMLLAIVYYAVLAVNRYESSAQVVVRQSNGDAQSMVPGLALLMSGVNPASREETVYLREFIVSPDMLKVLEDKLQWTQHFSAQWRDPLYWTNSEAPLEDRLVFYRRLVNVYYDELTGLLTVNVEALEPEFAQQVLAEILAESERFVNEFSHSMARDQLRFAESELILAKKLYEDKKQVMLQFQSRSKLLSGQTSIESRAAIISTLEADITREKASLTALLASLSVNSPQVRQQQIKISALAQQLEAEKRFMLSTNTNDRLNVVAAEFRNLEIDVVIAEETYKAGVAAVQNARVEASKKIRSLVRVVTPNMPEAAVYPRRLYGLFTLFIGLLLVYGITRFVVATIKDHRD